MRGVFSLIGIPIPNGGYGSQTLWVEGRGERAAEAATSLPALESRIGNVALHVFILLYS